MGWYYTPSTVEDQVIHFQFYTLHPLVPSTLYSDDITVVTSLEGPSTMLSFDVRIIMCHVIPILVSCDLQDPSPCAEFSVEEYVLMFTEVTNSEDILSAFNTGL